MEQVAVDWIDYVVLNIVLLLNTLYDILLTRKLVTYV